MIKAMAELTAAQIKALKGRREKAVKDGDIVKK